ncbi:MAG: hypothetical protein ABIA66_00825 [Candidatus Omnitrophota bacterium]
MFNFRDIAEVFCKAEAAIVAHNGNELKEIIGELLCNPDKIKALGNKARDLVSQYKGATVKNADCIKNILGGA